MITKGSVWRKWDLQVHIPESKHANQYQTKDNLDVWDQFIEDLHNSDVSVFGITDYFLIDGYEKFLEKIKNTKKLKDKVFFPNIEFRLDINTNRSSEEVNMHVIFDNAIELEKIKKFLSDLELFPKKRDGTYCRCTSEDLNEPGFDAVSVSLSALEKALKKSFGNEKPYLTAASYRGYGGSRYGTPKKTGRIL